ncbi:MAG: amidohydrolase [Pseudobdellovibrionaceae bacterium]
MLQMYHKFSVPNCYDSHVHLMATGETASILSLATLRKPEDVKDLNIPEISKRGEWIVGFGWDHSLWPEGLPTKEILDHYFPNQPVNFTRADGHTAWVNSEALRRILLLGKKESEFPSPAGGKIIRDSSGVPTGILVDTAKLLIDQIVPSPTDEQVATFLKKGVEIFNRAGFTHVRDMTSTPKQFALLKTLNSQAPLSLAVESYFVLDSIHELDLLAAHAVLAKKDSPKNMRLLGLKIFFDGALGSEGAYISQNYQGSSENGKIAWSKEEIQKILSVAFDKNIECAFHTIGDEAVHFIASWALDLKNQDRLGSITFEHAELIRPETIELLSELQAKVYMQPCHWLTDRVWLEKKLGRLAKHAFPWQALEKKGITFFFGSDSPIEPTSIFSNIQALNESSKQGIAPISKSYFSYQSHPDKNWCPAISHFEDGKCTGIQF